MRVRRVSNATRQWAINVCKKYKVKYRFLNKNLGYAWADPPKQMIFVPLTHYGAEEFKCLVLHEIAHCLNYRNKKYYKFHNLSGSNKYNRTMGLRAEVYTEKVAAKLARKLGLKRYQHIYKFDKRSRDFVNHTYRDRRFK